jgi:hypothetical protein
MTGAGGHSGDGVPYAAFPDPRSRLLGFRALLPAGFGLNSLYMPEVKTGLINVLHVARISG